MPVYPENMKPDSKPIIIGGTSMACDKHETHNASCGDCRMRRLVELDRKENKCICPILSPTPGGCPVHGG